MPQTIGRKVPIRLQAVNGLLVLLLLGGCGPIVHSASFNQRPDSVKHGSLLGPFEGRVVNADTDQPIADALVWCSWSFNRGVGNVAPERVETMETLTDADGSYRLPALRRFPQGLSTHLATFSFIIYKRGYVAYRHDRIFNQRRRRRTFSQLNNLVKLSRWSPELSHARHLLFIGGGRSLRKASRWEVMAAVAELEGHAQKRSMISGQLSASADLGTKAKRRLDAGVLLSSDDVRAITGYTGEFKRGRLSGPSSDTYDTFHLRAIDKPERYDVAIRLWRLGDNKLEEKYEEVLNALPGSKQDDKVGDRSFTVLQGEIIGLGFYDRTWSALVLVTCGKGQCSKSGHLLALATKIASRLNLLPPLSTESNLLTPDKEPKPQGQQQDQKQDAKTDDE